MYTFKAERKDEINRKINGLFDMRCTNKACPQYDKDIHHTNGILDWNVTPTGIGRIDFSQLKEGNFCCDDFRDRLNAGYHQIMKDNFIPL